MPTPVSALIHAATMVTAGVYLLMRASPLIEYSSIVLMLCLCIGAITNVFSSLVGLFQQDIKKVIAYSTMSQVARGYLLFVNRTVCVEDIYKAYIYNSQITKARDYNNHISSNLINSFNHLIKQWRIIIISKLVGISEAIRSILVCINLFLSKFTLYKLFFSFIFKHLCSLHIIIYFLNSFFLFFAKHNLFNNSNNNILTSNVSEPDKSLNQFNEWLAGLIDGDGYFLLTKKGYVSCEITMDIKDKAALYEIKHKYGGSIKSMSGANSSRYKLRHKKGIIDLINGVNGLIRNPIRLLQLNKLCVKYNIKLKEPKPLTYNNGWFSGLLDSDGSIYFNEKAGQLYISVTQKNKFLLEPLKDLYGGKIYILSPKIEAFKYTIYRKNEVLNLIDDYIKKYPLKTAKSFRVHLAKDYYLLKDYKSINVNHMDKYSEWITFKNKWEKYNN